MKSLSQLRTLRPNAKLHFSGIGGIGMSGLAEIMNKLGYQVQGSDLASNYNTKRLEDAGVKIFYGQKEASHLAGISFMVKSSAIRDSNSELVYCREHNIPVISRADFLKELMRTQVPISISGAHGKTTTTSMVAALLEHAGLDPTVVVGGIISGRNTNVHVGSGEFMVVEADESDGTFVQIPSTIAVVTNIDKEHLDHYGSFDNLKQAFHDFISNIAFYGFGVLCLDDEYVRELVARIHSRELVTYGIESADVDVRAINVRTFPDHSLFDIVYSAKIDQPMLCNVKLGVPGLHNIQNALAVASIAAKLGLKPEHLRAALQGFHNVKRRLTLTQEVDGIRFVDDYAHHPSEIVATLSAARQMAAGNGGRVIAVFQPHRFTRVKNLFSEFTGCFGGADVLYLADIYSAQEDLIYGITSAALVEAIKRAHPDKPVSLLSDWKTLPASLKTVCRPNDIVLFMGAGDITDWAYQVPKLFAGE